MFVEKEKVKESFNEHIRVTAPNHLLTPSLK